VVLCLLRVDFHQHKFAGKKMIIQATNTRGNLAANQLGSATSSSSGGTVRIGGDSVGIQVLRSARAPTHAWGIRNTLNVFEKRVSTAYWYI